MGSMREGKNIMSSTTADNKRIATTLLPIIKI